MFVNHLKAVEGRVLYYGMFPFSHPVYMLNVWRPPADLQAQLKEGARYRVYNLSVTAGKNRNPGAPIQLTATNKTHFQEIQVPHAQIQVPHEIQVPHAQIQVPHALITHLGQVQFNSVSIFEAI